MNEKDINRDKELERFQNELFGSFDPNDELWMVGGSRTITAMATYSRGSIDVEADVDFWEFEAQ